MYYNLEEKIYDIVNRICLELVANSLKHTEAKTISINLSQDYINILAIDNGVGTDDLVLGTVLVI